LISARPINRAIKSPLFLVTFIPTDKLKQTHMCMNLIQLTRHERMMLKAHGKRDQRARDSIASPR
jgi:hypothetical protein